MKACKRCGSEVHRSPRAKGRVPEHCESCRAFCSFAECAKPRAESSSLCAMHRSRHARGRQSMDAISRERQDPECAAADCAEPSHAKQLCPRHYGLAAKAGQLNRTYVPRAARKIVNGYALVPHPELARHIPEHRLVMERVLGRPLRSFENVHHKNGRRAQNDISNLELWTKPQPAGQRPEDLVAWVLDNYTNLVEAELKARKREARTGQLRLVESI